MEPKKILCVYATRQIDSNLLMSSTVFRGLKEACYEVYMVYAGTTETQAHFRNKYAHYFKEVFYIDINTSIIKKISDKHPYTKLAYSFYRHFIIDGITHLPIKGIENKLKNLDFEIILSFIPPVLSGRLAIDIKRKLCKKTVKLIQFWTDPLTLGKCDNIYQVPKTRILHRINEKWLIRQANRIVFWFPLLCQMEKQLYPDYASKMCWSDVSFIERAKQEYIKNTRIKIGLFGAYPASVRNIIPLITAIHDLKSFDFIICGDGDLPSNIELPSNVTISTKRISTIEIEKLESQCDILLSLSSYHGIAPGGKTFYYASYPKPIIHIADGENGTYYNQYLVNLGERYICCLNNIESIKAAILQAVDELPTFELKIPERMDAAVIAKKIIEG